MELLSAFAIKARMEPEQVRRILECVTTEEAVRILEENEKKEEVMERAMERIYYYLNKRANGKMQLDCIMYANDFGELVRSREAEKWFTLLAQDAVR